MHLDKRKKWDIKYLKGGGKITIFTYGIILYLKSPRESPENYQNKNHGGKFI